MKYIFVLFSLLFLTTTGCATKQNETKSAEVKPVAQTFEDKNLEHATFAMGCFWHSEEIFLEVKGVKESLPGYSGGTEKDPSYEMVGTGSTGYAESVDVTYDPSVISYQKLLEIFFAEHDPTTPNYAYPDEGQQYRSVIFYRNADQKKQAEDYIAKLSSSHKYDKPIVTQVSPFTKFYKAEDYHQQYYENNSGAPYCQVVIAPKLEKLEKKKVIQETPQTK